MYDRAVISLPAIHPNSIQSWQIPRHPKIPGCGIVPFVSPVTSSPDVVYAVQEMRKKTAEEPGLGKERCNLGHGTSDQPHRGVLTFVFILISFVGSEERPL